MVKPLILAQKIFKSKSVFNLINEIKKNLPNFKWKIKKSKKFMSLNC